MNDDNSNSPWPASRSNTEAAFDGTSDCVDFDLHDPTHPASSSLVGFLQDDASTIDSYFSTWSSNYTMPDLPGPGRLLGNLMSSAGSSLERCLGKLAYRAGLGSYAKAEANLRKYNLCGMLRSEDMIQKEKACNILLGYASSYNPAVQLMAFYRIMVCTVLFPSLPTPSVVEMVCRKRNEQIDLVTFSWNQPGLITNHCGLVTSTPLYVAFKCNRVRS